MTSKQKFFGLVLLALTLLIAIAAYKTEPEVDQVPEVTIEDIEIVATSSQAVIGTSVENRDIETFIFGTGKKNILFVGGIHGGYEANSVRLAEAMIEEFQLYPELIPEDITVHIIPVLNPDGYAKALDPVANYSDAAKRFNANGVDLNRNFDCRWAPESSWRGAVVDAGTNIFSEPEAIALRDYVSEINPSATVFWHSMAGNVYGSECGGGVSEETLALVNTYAEAGNYGAVPVFDAYTVTGAAEDWLASLGIPAVTVELETRESIEWERNKAGTLAVLELYNESLTR